jgi:Fe2+ transport system protein FeoA
LVSELTLEKLEINETATIVKIYGEDDLVVRLSEAGFIPGSQVTSVLKTPFGGPAAYKIQGAKIALRREDSEKIVVNRS